MGVVKKRGNYWLDYRVKGRRYRQKVGLSKTVADKAWAKVQVQIAEDKFLDIKKTLKIKLRDFSVDFINLHCKVNHSSWEKASLGRVKSLNRFFGNMYLHEVTVPEIERMKAQRLKEVSPATVNRELAGLKCLFNRAKAWGKFYGENPVKEVKFLKETNHLLRYLDAEEITQLLEVAKKPIKGIIITALNTGMRRGEILNLKWVDIDFHQKIIHLLKTKSGKKREIPINKILSDTLVGIRKNPRSSYVFCKKNGEPYKDIRTIFLTALKHAGITKKCRFHDLRHTFASHLVMSGIDLNTVRELLGHADLKTTLIYAHLSRDHKKRAVEVLSPKMETKKIPKENMPESIDKVLSISL